MKIWVSFEFLVDIGVSLLVSLTQHVAISSAGSFLLVVGCTVFVLIEDSVMCFY